MKLLAFILCIAVFARADEKSENKLKLFLSENHKITQLSYSSAKLNVDNEQSFTHMQGVIIAELFDGQKKFEIKFNYYKSDATVLHPLVINLPPIIGSTPIEQNVARMLALNGTDVIVPQIPDLFSTGKSLAEVEEYMVNFTVTMRLLIKNISQNSRFNIDREKIGVFGLSLGAVIAASFVGIIDEINYAYILAGGGNLAKISAMSSQSKVKDFKTNIIKSGAVSELDWEAVIKNTFSFDPLDFAKRAQHKKIFMVMCKEDEMIPYSLQLELWEAFARPKNEIVTYYSHLGTIIRWYIKSSSELIDFFKTRH